LGGDILAHGKTVLDLANDVAVSYVNGRYYMIAEVPDAPQTLIKTSSGMWFTLDTTFCPMSKVLAGVNPNVTLFKQVLSGDTVIADITDPSNIVYSCPSTKIHTLLFPPLSLVTWKVCVAGSNWASYCKVPVHIHRWYGVEY